MSPLLRNCFRKLIKPNAAKLRLYSSKQTKDNEKEVCLPKDPSCTARLSDCPQYKEKPCQVTPALVSKYVSCCMNKNLTKPPCEENAKSKKKLRKYSEFKSMWVLPEGYRKPCPDFVERLDEKHYKPTDKDKRRYTQTWISCKTPLKRKRRMCAIIIEGAETPPLYPAKRSKTKLYSIRKRQQPT